MIKYAVGRILPGGRRITKADYALLRSGTSRPGSIGRNAPSLPRLNRLAYYRNNSLTDADGNYDITAVSHPSDTVLTPGNTYSLHAGLWAALGGVEGVDHWAFTSVGVPKVVSYEVIQSNANQPWGYIFWSVKRGLCVFDPATPLATMRKVWKYMLGYSGLWYTGLNIYGETQTWPVDYADYFVDSVRGSDSSDGLSPFTPFATIADLDGLLADGVKIGLAAGSSWQEELDLFACSNCSVLGYGKGKRPILDAASQIPNNLFALLGGTSNVYQATWVHGVYESSYMSVWEDGERLTYVSSTSLCDTTPGSFYVQYPCTSPVIVSVHPRNSTNPLADGKLYEAAKRDYGLHGNDYLTVKFLHTKRNGHNDGSLAVTENTNIFGCMCEDGTKHNMFFSSGTVEDFVSWKIDPSTRTGATAIVAYAGLGAGKTAYLKNIIVSADAMSDKGAFLSHTATVDEGLDRIEIDNFVSNIDGIGLSPDVAVISKFKGQSVSTSGHCSATINDSFISLSRNVSGKRPISCLGNITISNSIVMRSAPGALVYGAGGIAIHNSVLHFQSVNSGQFGIASSDLSTINIDSSIFFNVTAGVSGTASNNNYAGDYNVVSLSSMDMAVNGDNYYTFQSYLDAEDTDMHSIIATPIFIDPSNGNFGLQEGSPGASLGAGITANIEYLEILSDEILAQW